MNLSLSNFESNINSTILNRGKNYFSEGLVADLEEIGDNYWSALVSGTEVYNVKVKTQNNEIIESVCDCPYDLGPICKHETAVYYAIKEHLSDGVPKAKTVKRKARKKRATAADKINAAIKTISLEELINIVKNYALENREFRSIILSQSQLDKSGDKKSFYRSIVKESLNSGKDRYGFIDYWGSKKAVRGADELMQKTEQMDAKKEVAQIIAIYQVVVEELAVAISHADDSNGDLGGTLNWAFEKLYNISETIKDSQIKKDLFKYCIKEVDNKRYDGWSDWQWNLIEVAANCISNKTDEESLFKKMDEMYEQEHGWSEKYNRENAAKTKLKIIEKFHGQKKAREFVYKNLELTPMRRAAIGAAMENKKFEEAKKLAQDGIQLDNQRGWPGLVCDWRKKLLDIAEVEKNISDIRKYARISFLDGRGEFEFYEKYKKSFSKKEWPKALNELLGEMRNFKNPHAINYYTFSEIYIREKMWDDLLNLAKKHISGNVLNSFHKYLAKYFPEDLIEMYEQVCREKLEQVAGRAYYQEVCRYLRRMKKLGAGEKVETLIREFQEAYPRRPALIEELLKV